MSTPSRYSDIHEAYKTEPGVLAVPGPKELMRLNAALTADNAELREAVAVLRAACQTAGSAKMNIPELNAAKRVARKALAATSRFAEEPTK